MPKKTVLGFRGMIPSRNPAFLKEYQAQLAVNCKFDRGTLAPFSSPKVRDTKEGQGYGGLSVTDSVYDDHPVWLDWVHHCVKSPIHNNDKRVAYCVAQDRYPGAFESDDEQLVAMATAGVNIDPETYGFVLGVEPPNVTLSAEHLTVASDKPVYKPFMFSPEDDDWDNPDRPGFVPPRNDEDGMEDIYYKDQLLSYMDRHFRCKKTAHGGNVVPLVLKEVQTYEMSDIIDGELTGPWVKGDILKIDDSYYRCKCDDGCDEPPLVPKDESEMPEFRTPVHGETVSEGEIIRWGNELYEATKDVAFTADGTGKTVTDYKFPLLFDDGYKLVGHISNWDSVGDAIGSFGGTLENVIWLFPADRSPLKDDGVSQMWWKATVAQPETFPYYYDDLSQDPPYLNEDEYESWGNDDVKLRSTINTAYWKRASYDDYFELSECWERIVFEEDEYYVVRGEYWQELSFPPRMKRSVSYVYTHVRRWEEGTMDPDTGEGVLYFTWSAGMVAEKKYRAGWVVKEGSDYYELLMPLSAGDSVPQPSTHCEAYTSTAGNPKWYEKIEDATKIAELDDGSSGQIVSPPETPEEESMPGPASEPIDIWNASEESEQVDTYVKITGFDDWRSLKGVYAGIPLRAWKVDTYRVYRSVTGNTGTDWHFALEFVGRAGTVKDTNDDDELDGGLLQTGNWSPPPRNLKGLISASNGMFFGWGESVDKADFLPERHIQTNELVVSPPYIHYAYPRDYALTVDGNIVGLGNFGNTVVVLTDDKPYLCVGSDPTTLNMVPLPHRQACVSEHSIVNTANGVIFASPDGLFLIGQNGQGSLVTKNIWNKQDWNLPLRNLTYSGLATIGSYNNPEDYRDFLKPEKVHGALYEGLYFGFWECTPFGFVFDPEVGDIRYIDLGKMDGETDVIFTAMDYHSLTDSLYIAVASGTNIFDAYGKIWEWEGMLTEDVEDKMLATWQSADFQYPAVMAPFSIARFQFVSDASDSLGFQIYGDGSPLGRTDAPGGSIWTHFTDSNNVFRLPGGKRYSMWSIRLHSDNEIKSIEIATSLGELMNE